MSYRQPRDTKVALERSHLNRYGRYGKGQIGPSGKMLGIKLETWLERAGESLKSEKMQMCILERRMPYGGGRVPGRDDK